MKTKTLFFIFLYSFLNYRRFIKCQKILPLKFSWKLLDYDYENAVKREEDISSGKFIPTNNVPFGVEAWKDKLFVTVPRRLKGVPSTLNYARISSDEKSPLLKPYPNWKENSLENGSIVSVFRINVDKCDRLWFVDTGAVVDFQGRGTRVRKPNLQVYNLTTDQRIVNYPLKPDQFSDRSGFTNVIVDAHPDNCADAFAYVTDPGDYSLIVYSLSRNDSWRIKHPYFHIDPLSADFKIAGLEFQWDDGIFGVALSKIREDGYSRLYFHPMVTSLEFEVSTKILRNSSSAIGNNNRQFRILGSRGFKGQSTASSLDESTGVMFFPLVNKYSLACWNTARNYSSTELVGDEVGLIYVSDLKVDKGGHLWVISNRLPISLYSHLDISDVNFRVFRADVRRLIAGTACDSKG